MEWKDREVRIKWESEKWKRGRKEGIKRKGLIKLEIGTEKKRRNDEEKKEKGMNKIRGRNREMRRGNKGEWEKGTNKIRDRQRIGATEGWRQ